MMMMITWGVHGDGAVVVVMVVVMVMAVVMVMVMEMMAWWCSW